MWWWLHELKWHRVCQHALIFKTCMLNESWMLIESFVNDLINKVNWWLKQIFMWKQTNIIIKFTSCFKVWVLCSHIAQKAWQLPRSWKCSHLLIWWKYKLQKIRLYNEIFFITCKYTRDLDVKYNIIRQNVTDIKSNSSFSSLYA